jgi:type IV pilus assembly protein PilC
MIKHWKYQALNKQGQEVSGVLPTTRQEVITFIKKKQWELIDLRPDVPSFLRKFSQRKSLSSKTMMVLFEDLSNMQQTGMSLSHMLLSLRDSTEDVSVIHVLEVLKEKIEEGQSLGDAFASTNAFPWVVILTLRSGEQSGKLEESFKLLSQFFKRQDDIRHRLREALTYPTLVFSLLITVMLFVGLHVIPKLTQLLPEPARAKGTAGIVIAMSIFLQKYFLFITTIPLLVIVSAFFVFKKYPRAYESLVYQIPLYGSIKKETDLAFYFLNLGILLRNGMPLIKCINDLNALNPSIVSRHFYKCRDYLFGGMPLWESLHMDPLFSSVVVFTIRRGEEMARLPEYCSNLSDYFNKRVYERIDQMVIFIQPVLLVMGGIFLIIIASAFLVPVYGSLTQIAGG